MDAEGGSTRWSLVLAAGSADAGAGDALQALLAAYRPVILAWFRRHAGSDAADDATQAFLLHFVEHRLAARADRERGSFRAFLHAAMQNHHRQAWRDAHAARRDAGLPAGEAALAALADPAPDVAAAFDRDWALQVVARAAERLRTEATRAGKARLFAALQPFLVEPPAAADYARIGGELGMSANHVAVAVRRLRERLRDHVRRELADTLAAGADVDAELAWLRRALRGD
ncbi:RNA polymerase sigma factor [Arenimonas composti]|uniref:RNA polymerase sigma-70 region 2 domain-containing protein n=1 Tax=Arenimonas composti TR7-09 = DSM 18010 TaxID=1121013 RepID=A0A091BJ39_9GAMM|nr:sigma-70 family RNA polymerase sigma factor [Arenimonas composti]KFN50799.1 hypothetical protein P873_05080 [Arenimonas composti TR7-09 = DSM 18010]